jgi:CubicO group peptidase (beta-lactamase class C family)
MEDKTMAESLESKWTRLGEFVTRVMEAKGVPGVAVGVYHGGEIATGGWGVTSVDNALPVTDQTLFQIGSITKTFVGTAMMRLVEAGKVDLDAPVRTYLPDFCVSDEAASAGATVRHLLIHTGGWAGDYFHDTGAGDDALARYVADMAELPQVTPLGEWWSYNNAAFSVAGRVIEVVSDKTLEATLSELVLEPLGLTHTFLDPGEVMTHRFAVGHNVEEGGSAQVARPWPLVRSGYAAGGLVCHVHDLLRYARFHLGDGVPEGIGVAEDVAVSEDVAPEEDTTGPEKGTRLLSEESLAQMTTPQVTVWGNDAWGLSWALSQVGGLLEISHGGGTNGQISLLGLIPERDFAFAVLTNAGLGGFLTREVRRWLLKEYLDLEVSEPQPIESSPEELAQYAGLYQGYFTDLELGMLGGRLAGQVTYKRGFPSEKEPPPPPPPPFSLARCEEDRLLVLDTRFKDATGDVLRRPEGSIGWLRISGRLHARQS